MNINSINDNPFKKSSNKEINAEVTEKTNSNKKTSKNKKITTLSLDKDLVVKAQYYAKKNGYGSLSNLVEQLVIIKLNDDI